MPIKETVEEYELAKSRLETKTKDVVNLESRLEQVSDQQMKTNKKLMDKSNEITALKQANDDFEKSKTEIVLLEQTIVSFKEKAQEQEDYIQQLISDLAYANNEQLLLEQKIREHLVPC